VRRFASLDELSRAAAAAVVQVAANAIAQRGRCALVLSGGRTPSPLYRLLATTHRDDVDWARVHLFWGDERWVPATDPLSNFRMTREALLDHVPCPPDQIHPMPVEAESPDAAARQYEHTLRTFFGDAGAGPDLLLLGMGSDGHTASLFPQSPALEERTRWVVPAVAPVEPRQRITLTIPAINRAMNIFLLVAGADKQSAFAEATSGRADPRRCPVAMVQPAAGNLTWWLTPMP
jgi:6-phosphogluconolactonase